MNHDVIVIGGSAGAVEVLLDLVSGLPADLPASVFVVIHTSPNYASLLPDLLERRGPMPARHPIHGETIERGVIYVAPADAHLLLRRSSMEVVRAAKENGHRPAVDPLFRTAAASHGSRVIGVVLSGYMDCGTAGMLSIKARGGLSVVQAPVTAHAPQMPESVLDNVAVDYTVSPAELPALLGRLSRLPAGLTAEPDRYVQQLEGSAAGKPAELVCPLCHGALTEAQPGVFEHFRCHVGHAFSLESLAHEQTEEMERALWASVRSLEEGARLARRMSTIERSSDTRRRYDEKARTLRHQADLIRQILLHGSSVSLRTGVSASPEPEAEASPPRNAS